MFSRSVKYLTIFTSTLFFGIYFFSIRLNKEEIAFINAFSEHDFKSFFSHFYQGWTPRVFASGLLLSLSQLCINKAYLWVFTGLTYSLIYVYAIFSFQKIIRDKCSTVITREDTLFGSILLFASFFFMCAVPSEVFGWYPCIFIYLLPCILLLNVLFRKHVGKSFNLFAAFVIASGAEHIAVFSIVAALAVSSSSPDLKERRRKELLMFAGLTAIFLLAFVVTTGTVQRLSFENSSLMVSVPNSFFSMIKNQVSPYFIIGVLTLCAFASVLPDFSLKLRFRPGFALIIIAYALTFMVDLAIFSHSKNGGRIWFITNVLNALILIGLFSRVSLKANKSLKAVILVGVFIALETFFISHGLKLLRYAKSYDGAVYNYQHFKSRAPLLKVPDPGITSASFPDFSEDVYARFYFPNEGNF